MAYTTGEKARRKRAAALPHAESGEPSYRDLGGGPGLSLAQVKAMRQVHLDQKAQQQATASDEQGGDEDASAEEE